MFLQSGFKRTLCGGKWQSLSGNNYLTSTGRLGCCPIGSFMSNPFVAFLEADSCTACPSNALTTIVNADISCTNNVCPTGMVYLDTFYGCNNCGANAATCIIDQIATTCDAGYGLVGSACVACDAYTFAVQGNSAACETCATSGNGANATTITCTSGTNQVAATCDAGYWLDEDACSACATSGNGANAATVTCTSGTNQIATTCDAGYGLVGSACVALITQADVDAASVTNCSLTDKLVGCDLTQLAEIARHYQTQGQC